MASRGGGLHTLTELEENHRLILKNAHFTEEIPHKGTGAVVDSLDLARSRFRCRRESL